MIIVNPYRFALDETTKLYLSNAAIPNDSTLLYAGTAKEIKGSVLTTKVNNFVRGAKYYNLWSKIIAAYPFHGGNDNGFKYNLKLPTIYNLQFFNTFSYDGYGIKGNGTNAYADTFIIPNSDLTLNNTHLSFFATDNDVTSTNIEFGCNNGLPSSELALAVRRSDDNAISVAYNETDAEGLLISVAGASAEGLTVASRLGITHFLSKNGSVIGTEDNSGGSLPSNKLFMFGTNAGGAPLAGFYSKTRCGFATVGYGLTTTEAANLNSLIQEFRS